MNLIAHLWRRLVRCEIKETVRNLDETGTLQLFTNGYVQYVGDDGTYHDVALNLWLDNVRVWLHTYLPGTWRAIGTGGTGATHLYMRTRDGAADDAALLGVVIHIDLDRRCIFYKPF
jgi:hypothetical protein